MLVGAAVAGVVAAGFFGSLLANDRRPSGALASKEAASSVASNTPSVPQAAREAGVDQELLLVLILALLVLVFLVTVLAYPTMLVLGRSNPSLFEWLKIVLPVELTVLGSIAGLHLATGSPSRRTARPATRAGKLGNGAL